MGPKVIVLVSLLVCQLCITINGDYTYVFSWCTDTGLNYSIGSSFDLNFNLFLSAVTSKTSLKFYNYSVGDDTDKVYGLFQCRYDVGFDVCNSCIGDATRTIVQVCPVYREATVWYEECMLRYANRNIFSLYERQSFSTALSGNNATNPAELSLIVENAMNGVIRNASSASTHSASGITNRSSSEQLFSFAQCTPDINTYECSHCLASALEEILYWVPRAWGMTFSESCQLWYKTNGPILNDTFTASAPPSPPKQHQGSRSRPPPAKPPSTETTTSSSSSSSSKNTTIVIGAACASVGMLVLLVVLCICVCRKRPKEANNDVPPTSSNVLLHGDDGLGDAEFVQFNFATLKAATGDFSMVNTLGKGGFGFVYKGTLVNGEQLAIKRLSSTSGQGTKEFMAEARFLAKLQHTNLVKLVGFCLEKEEKLLVYEFMSNSSLERYLFDPVKRLLLDWVTRFNIILGIAKGLRYLHEDSRLTIIHRDLKPDNILLDNEMNPKIADFGLAKLTGVVEKRGTTNRIIGTQGYMAPECFMGEFSDKSDVYSFGVMLLEIVSGQNNLVFYQSTKKADLPSHAWRLWKEGQAFELTDPQLDDNCLRDEVMRCIHVGLLCLQSDEEKRPRMSSVVYMLMGLGDLPLPSALVMSTPQLSMPIYSGEQRTYTDHYSTNSVTMASDLSQDLDPKPR